MCVPDLAQRWRWRCFVLDAIGNVHGVQRFSDRATGEAEAGDNDVWGSEHLDGQLGDA